MGFRFYVILFLAFAILPSSYGQANSNPFDLPSDEKEQASESKRQLENPFEIGESTQSQVIVPHQSATESSSGKEIGLGVGILILLALLLTFFRGVFNDFVESAYRDRKFNQFFRRMKSMWNLPNILFYLYFCLTIGVFVFLTLEYFNGVMHSSSVQFLGIIIASILTFFIVKHLVLDFIGSTFEVANETSRYSLLIMTFNIIVGIVITPFVILLLLGPDNLQGAVIILGIILVSVVLGLFLLRSLSVSNRLLVQHSFHFFMYLCAIEIAPLFIIAKVLS